MNAQTAIKPDEIYTFMGHIPAEEYERRAKLRSYRNAASGMIASTECDTARQLAWLVVEYATPNLYADAPVEWLDKLNLLSKRLMLTAMQAEEMTLLLREVSDA
ncbi:hypothetical protein A9995_02680 [Erythrobacter sp. QSSC1-22B]|uniref:hypothetical protein n=1 Tax=Erythrobacter sp. QSSC1-22B TaxID=1860125 RepID=UPI00080484E6|nr:hypothetical protein [Erythrobacter sp. QSSC1-22B]OBX20623.1 hypothetical protein A9995_02680 [Erythrobacter sp. QSSC1-22B]